MGKNENSKEVGLYVIGAYFIFFIVNLMLDIMAVTVKISIWGKVGMEWTGVGIMAIIGMVVLAPINTLILYIFYNTNINKSILVNTKIVLCESICYFMLVNIIYLMNLNVVEWGGHLLIPYIVICCFIFLCKIMYCCVKKL